ncbi:MAG: hypothetical protein M3373_10930 [Gemmatimonadota bacterium]|nr:hypothetical protein [Gemmatimonadota bacterium]
MRPIPAPAIPWQVTGNHWLAIPCIHPADGSLHALGVLHRGARASVEVAGSESFLDGAGPALLRPVLRIGGKEQDLARRGLAWERALNWLPTFTCSLDTLIIRGTIFAPYGRDADVAGAVYAVGFENRSAAEVRATLSAEGLLGHRQIRVRTPRPAVDRHRVSLAEDVVLLEGTALPGLVAIAVAADGEARVTLGEDGSGTFALEREITIPAEGRASAAFYVAAGPDRDGAEAAVGVMRRRGWSELLTGTREALQSLDQTVGNDSIDRLINRNLLFAYFYGAGRALDDAHYYFVRTRAPWHSLGVTARDWEALSWTLPAIQLADASLARELLLRACELHGYAPGTGVHYLDGTLFEPGFSLEGAASFALAADRYIRETGDDQVVEEPALADALYNSADDLASRRDEHVPLYTTELTVAGVPASYPFTLHGNAVAAQALEVLRRTLDEETSRGIPDPDAVRAALRRHFAVERDGRVTLASAIDLAGHSTTDDGASGAALWLPLYGAIERHDSVYRRTVKGIGAEPRALVEQCARLMGPEAGDVLRWLRRAPLDNGLAAETVDADGRAVADGGDAALSGLLAWSVWYAIHALGARP